MFKNFKLGCELLKFYFLVISVRLSQQCSFFDCLLSDILDEFVPTRDIIAIISVCTVFIFLSMISCCILLGLCVTRRRQKRREGRKGRDGENGDKNYPVPVVHARANNIHVHYHASMLTDGKWLELSFLEHCELVVSLRREIVCICFSVLSIPCRNNSSIFGLSIHFIINKLFTIQFGVQWFLGVQINTWIFNSTYIYCFVVIIEGKQLWCDTHLFLD